jgi:hypothetical protein
MSISGFTTKSRKGSSKNSPWNTLEVAKLLVTPIVVALLGFVVQGELAAQSRATQELLANQTRNWQQHEKLVEHRINAYESISFQLNRIYCFIEDVGPWKQDDPKKIIEYKRHIDGIMHEKRALWSPETFQTYLEYMNDHAFKTFTGVGEDAKIRTDLGQKVTLSKYDKSWETMIETPKDSRHREAYDRLMKLFAKDLQWMGEANP